MQVVKRDGRLVNFNAEKIENAILAAFNEVDGEISQYARDKAASIANDIKKISETTELTIAEIQSIIEDRLMNSKRRDVARAYIEYRSYRDRERERGSNFFKEITNKLNATSVQNQNANIDEASFGGRIGEATNAMMEKYALDFCMSDLARSNHLGNMIYTHDLNHYAIGNHNCLSIPFDELLANGFNTRQTDIRPAQSVSTAFQLVAVIFQLQSLQQFGGVSATHIDWTMVPYVRKSFCKHYTVGMSYLSYECPETHCLDKFREVCCDGSVSIDDEYYKAVPNVYKYAMDMTIKEVYQAVEGMYHNLNTLQSRSGNQLE